MKQLNPKIIQLIGDAVIPLLGFFWWNWSLYFIVIFYLLDYLSNEVILNLKSKKITTYQEIDSKIWVKKASLSFLLFLLGIVLVHLSMKMLHPQIDFYKEFIQFLSYKDMGIAQGYFLLPLIALVGFQRYKMEFLMPARFKTLTIPTLWSSHFKMQFILIACVAFTIGFQSLIALPETVYIIAIVVVTSVYQLVEEK
ncbi:MAG: hypothetical protein RI883_2614 [Bacteroidota bacterium]|jgi:hypothetical protein